MSVRAETRGPGGHDHLHVHRHGPLHRVPAHLKLGATLAFVAAVVLTDRSRVGAFAVHATIVLVALGVARVPLRRASLQMLIEAPVLLFALSLPFVVGGPHVEVGPLHLSSDGLWGAWNIVAKATLGVAAVVALTATTPVADLLDGLRRLRAPKLLIAIASFMVRYLDILQSELRRMSIARIARCDRPRWFWQARAVAATAGSLFVRSYERGERVHLAMMARGFQGTLPAGSTSVQPTAVQWVAVSAAPAIAAFVGIAPMLGKAIS